MPDGHSSLLAPFVANPTNHDLSGRTGCSNGMQRCHNLRRGSFDALSVFFDRTSLSTLPSVSLPAGGLLWAPQVFQAARSDAIRSQDLGSICSCLVMMMPFYTTCWKPKKKKKNNSLPQLLALSKCVVRLPFS